MTEEFNELIRQLGETVYQKVQAEMADREWVRACLDVRYSQAGDSWLTKTRAVAPNGTCVSIKMCNEIDIILISLNSHRKLFQDEWYGLQITVSESRDCQVKLNYDAYCSEDASFFGT